MAIVNEMLKGAKRNGIYSIYLSVHFLRDKIYINYFFDNVGMVLVSVRLLRAAI